MNDDLNKMIEGYITEAEECIQAKDDNRCRLLFWRIKAGMDKQPNWTLSSSFAFYYEKNDGTYLLQMPKVIEALKSYKIARQIEAEQLHTGKQSPSAVLNVNNNNTLSQSLQLYISVTFEQVIKWVNENSSLGAPETEEILTEIKKIQAIADSPEPKKAKWDKLKPFLLWLGDKGVDLAIQVIPLIMMTIQ